MLRNYFLTAKRVLLNKVLFTILNVAGLAIGIAASALIFHYIQFERSFDEYHPNSNNVYRLTYGRTMQDGSNVEFASACPPIAPLLIENFPEIKRIARLAHREATMSHEENMFIESKIYYAEQDIFDILKFDIIDGSIEQSLTQPNNIVISHSVAVRYFGDASPIGKRLKLNKQDDLQVVAVFDDVPDNSHLKPEILVAFPNLRYWRGEDYMQAWGHTGAFTYLVLDPNADPRELEKGFIEFTKSQIGEMLDYYKMHMYFNLQSIEDIHLTSKLLQEQEVNGDDKAVNFLVIIGFFILLVAWVNYINLTTSRSMERAKEVGIRKVVGAVKANLVKQFYTESVIINLIAMFLAMALVEVAKYKFFSLTGLPDHYSMWSQQWFIIFLIGAFMVGTFITGMYPVFALSSFEPIKVLKSKLVGRTRGINLRKILVVFQLFISLVLITGTLTVFSQLRYLSFQDTGFNMEQMLVINVPKAIDSTYSQRQSTFKEEIRKRTGVKGVGYSSEVPGRQIYWDNGGIYQVGQDATSSKNYMIMAVDDQFIDLYKMEMLLGRNFSKDHPMDKESLILNETAVRWLEYESPEQALNSQISYWGNIYTVVGIMKDYHHESPKALYEPQIFRFWPELSRGCFSVKLEEKSIKHNLKMIKSNWDELFPGNPFDYFFLDKYYDEQFKSDRKFGGVFGIFAFLAIFITCLGLFGLSLYTANLRTKEIGIRKVLGASVTKISTTISNEYFYLILISLVIAVPVLLWGIREWLQNFSSKMPVTIWLFIIPLVTVFLITMVSVSAHTIRAARSNPVDTLKYE